MSDTAAILEAARIVALVDWPSRDVPDALARAGYTIHVKGGPGDEDWSLVAMRDGVVESTPSGRAPEHADIVYAHRPLAEITTIVDLARRLGARTVWHQSGLSGTGQRDPRGCYVATGESRQAREAVEAAGLRYVDDVYIVDAVTELHGRT